MYQMISDQLPSDPPNKTAISLRYYFPSQYGDYYLINEDEIIWYDHTGRMLVTTPQYEWGEYSEDYYFIYEDLKNLNAQSPF